MSYPIIAASIYSDSCDDALVVLVPAGADPAEAAVEEWQRQFAPSASLDAIWADLAEGNLLYVEYAHVVDRR